LKGSRTLIAQPDGLMWVNTTGNPGMATGGTGDVLTGMMASLVAQYSAEDHGVYRVLAAVHLHGLSGDLARDELGEHSMTATDLLRFLPQAFRTAGERTGDRFVRIS
ncbi:MAG: ADP-dependent NAD(P)H-hydrate dehydratase, partial [Terriglobales bacterium]